MFGLNRKPKPAASSAFEPASGLSPVAVIVRDSATDSALDSVLDSAPSPKIRAADDPHEVARFHARCFLQWLIDTTSPEFNTLVYAEIAAYYRNWCIENDIPPRTWGMTGRYINDLLAPSAGDRRPREPYIDRETGKRKKRRFYVIPRRMPADWQARLAARGA